MRTRSRRIPEGNGEEKMLSMSTRISRLAMKKETVKEVETIENLEPQSGQSLSRTPCLNIQFHNELLLFV